MSSALLIAPHQRPHLVTIGDGHDILDAEDAKCHMKFRKSDAIGYKLKGKLSTKIGMLRTIPFEETGTLPIADLLGKKHKGG